MDYSSGLKIASDRFAELFDRCPQYFPAIVSPFGERRAQAGWIEIRQIGLN
jgi:hypothetical protein